MPETLQSPSCILLYGRLLRDLSVVPPADPLLQPGDWQPGPAGAPQQLGAYRPVQPPHLGANLFLQYQLRAPGAAIARIYGFAYEGHYFDLARPALFLVHGPGRPADRPNAPYDRRAKAPDKMDRLGVAATGTSFAEDMKVWAYDKGDFSLRMDVQTGPLEKILLETELASDVLKTFFGGATARLRSPGGGGVRD